MNFFGTDGIRAQVGEPPMTVDFILRLASAVAQVLIPKGGSVLIGKDTRISGYMLESALEAGFVAAGINVYLTGPLPTPGIAFLTKNLGANLGITISGSHNPYFDNGIKFFDKDGDKLSPDIEKKIESYLDQKPLTNSSKDLGTTTHCGIDRKKYQDFCKTTVSSHAQFSKFKVVADAANGACYKVLPRVISELGSEVVPIGCSPNGVNINDGCGSTNTDLLRLTVKGVKADVGIALDGDGDRLIMVDHEGAIVDGDKLLYILAKDRYDNGTLSGPVVGTIMNNLGLEKSLNDLGIEFNRANVGDRNILEMLKSNKGNIGGEPSGHLIDLDKTTTGDGLVIALQILEIMNKSGLSLKELSSKIIIFPQVLLNISIKDSFDPLSNKKIKLKFNQLTEEIGSSGRIVLRRSGTQKLIRLMVEGDDSAVISDIAKDLALTIRENI